RPEKVIRLLQHPAHGQSLYALMLGHCGKHEHAPILVEMLEQRLMRLDYGTCQILAGYVLLRPTEGWARVRDILKNPEQEFLNRYAGLRTARYVAEFQPQRVPRQLIIDAVAPLLEQSDIADLAIEDLRRWQRWELTVRVLGLFEKKSHDVPIIQRSILRFA